MSVRQKYPYRHTGADIFMPIFTLTTLSVVVIVLHFNYYDR